ncbi:MAG: SPFH domain-containing protein [Synechococcales bacterium]|nr:SPFH domain-containing protein [Synechococcales bacterium]
MRKNHHSANQSQFGNHSKSRKAIAISTALMSTIAIWAGMGTRSAIAMPSPNQTTIATQSITISNPPSSLPLAQTNSLAPKQQQTGNSINIFGIFPLWFYAIGGVLLFFVFLPKIGWVAGLIVIGEREVGIVTKKFSAKTLPAGRLIALEGEAGLQADTLSPGWHFGYFPWQYSVQKDDLVVIPQDEIGLIIANDGIAIPASRILGKVVKCENFQNARQFLLNAGEKGRQLAVLTTGTYRINTALFTVITSRNANQHGMFSGQLKVYPVKPDRVGIVTTLDGAPIAVGEIAGPTIAGHENYQNAQQFINGGGCRGLQEQVLLSGSWNLNPWFVQVEQVPMTEVPIGYVGVVISYVGKSHEDISGESFTHGNLVNKGDKGVWIEPLHTGKHPLNTQIMKVELVPTTNIVLNFTQRFKGEHGYDSSLVALRLLSFDGFSFELEVFQVIHVGAMDAPKVISRLGSMQNLIDQVLRPIVGNYFRNSAQEYTILDFLIARSERQTEAADYVRQALRTYDVQAVDTLIGMISPPPELMHTLTDRKIAEEQEKTYVTQRMAESQRQELVRETALADIQKEVVTAEEGVKIAKLQAAAQVEQANGEAESIRLTGEAKADAYLAGVNALGAQAYTSLQLMQVIGDRQVRVVPDVAVSGGNGGGILDAMLGVLLQQQNLETPNIKNGRRSIVSGQLSGAQPRSDDSK